MLDVKIQAHPELCKVISKEVFKKLDHWTAENFILTKKHLEEEEYPAVLNALFEIATYPDFFELATKHLLKFACSEVNLGVYRENYQALHFMSDLFRNASAKTKVKLIDRKKYLNEFLKKAKEINNYEEQFVLLKVLGTAANVFEPGEFSYLPDEHFDEYLHFAVDSLMQYTGQGDENGLDVTAEEELHELLKLTVDKPDIWGATDIPFRILKQYIGFKKTWNSDPVYHLVNFENSNEEYRKDKECDKEQLAKLELRLEQLASLFINTEFLTENFLFYRGAKKVEKICEIGSNNEETTHLQLHERQSLAERLIYNNTSNLDKIARTWPKSTYLIANFGWVMTNIPHQKGGSHKRIFMTMPIAVGGDTITGRSFNSGGHAEEAFYDYFLKEENIKTLIQKFMKKFNIKEGHKAYLAVFDFHGTYDMCLSCAKKAKDFQNEFRTILNKVFSELHLKGPTKNSEQMSVLIRYSSDIPYHYINAETDKRKGLPRVIKDENGDKHDLPQSTEKLKIEYDRLRDIQYFGANLVIHGGKTWHALWDTKKKIFTGKDLPLDAWTAFTTDYQNALLSKDRKTAPYTEKGKVVTTIRV